MPRRGDRLRRSSVALGAALLLACLTPLPALASGAAEPAAPASSQAVCVAEWFDDVTPGLSLTASTAVITSHGQTGTITCVGSVKGHAVTGPGTIGEQGSVTGTCASGAGTATFFMTIPTDGGPVVLILPVAFTYVGGVGLRPTGTFPGGFISAPTRGDCVLTPVTQIAVVMHGTLTT